MVVLFGVVGFSAWGQSVTQNTAQKTVTLTDAQENLRLTASYDQGCRISSLIVHDREVLDFANGVCSGIKAGPWISSHSTNFAPQVTVGGNHLTVENILLAAGEVQVRETWRFTVETNRILWRIDRDCRSGGRVEDVCLPRWEFSTMNTWTGGILDNGGVVWNRFLETANATYGARAEGVTFWNRERGDCLRVAIVDQEWPPSASAHEIVLRFSRQPRGRFPGDDDTFSFDCVPASAGLVPQYGLRRFLGDRQDLWQPLTLAPGKMSVEFSLQALDYQQEYGRGQFNGLHETTVREMLNTIGRYGVIDRHLVGGNGWRSGYICLHEPWFAEFGLALGDPNYIKNLAGALDYERDHALLPDGRVKSRWHHDAGDAQKGTYDALGFYEAQWGLLLDSQPGYVINVAGEFDLTGDKSWLKGQQAACERALDYLLRRDSAGDGLAEMATDDHAQNRASDWIDIIWASYKNALVNAELYHALTRWAGAEEVLGDSAKAEKYRRAAAKLKQSFNRAIEDGGFWDAKNQWYVYWRDKDNSIHGNNLVTPVNFAAIGYGLCDDPARQRAVLDRIERETQKERLFFWPLNIFPYERAEGADSNFPFPQYENGDLFLSWGELGVRAYVQVNPALAVKYIKQVMDRYEQDGLSFQRYLRPSQAGAGDDILAGNCSMAVALYRDIYGIQPRYDRLYLEPHLTPELDGTRIKYNLRGQTYHIFLNTNLHSIAVNNFVLHSSGAFAVSASAQSAEFYTGADNDYALRLTRSGAELVTVTIKSWPEARLEPRQWIEFSSRSLQVEHAVNGLQPDTPYYLLIDGKRDRTLTADAGGQIKFAAELEAGTPKSFDLMPQLKPRAAPTTDK